MALGTIILCFAIASISPLTDDQRTALDTAFDGRDHQEAAFTALVENVRSWTHGIGDAAIRLEPDYQAMLVNPEKYRGELCKITGKLQQHNPLPGLNKGLGEWFVRDSDSRPILVYIVKNIDDQTFRDGQAVEIIARFYKRVDAIAKDGEEHSYPAFVGAFPESALTATGSASNPMLVLAIPVAIGLVVFIILLAYTRHIRNSSKEAHRRSTDSLLLDEDVSLPKDPAQALTQLKRHGEA
ncbi:MAG: hypothetical protein IH984_07985 [Planctomycetes bacterium]|nr:hypothetical protein [Planctomycetota bacterium]